jgi:predicted amidohydrolase YtcJ
MLESGAKLATIRLDECESPEEMAALVAARAKDTPPGTWIIGQGWNEGNFRDSRLPTRHDIDPATADHPVVLMRFFNTDVVNSYALRLAGITRSTPDPDQGRIERDADGEPNGLLRAKAKGLVRRLIPQPSADETRQALRLGCREMLRFGITSVIEPGLNSEEIRAYQSFYEDGDFRYGLGLINPADGYAQGVGHPGQNFGYSSWSACLPEDQAVIVVLRNFEDDHIFELGRPLVMAARSD